MRTRLSLLSRVRWDRKDSSVLEHCRMKATMKLRIPARRQRGKAQGLSMLMRTLTLLPGKNLPSCHDHIVENLQREIFATG